MKRIIFQLLKMWKLDSKHKPLILRGARQVGKTHLVRQLGKTFPHFLEINFEKLPKLKTIFSADLNPLRIRELLELHFEQSIIPGKTLVFFDEVQECPQAIISLRYFYEELPQLHIIAAGSLLDFAIEKIGIPVGRVTFLYLYPMTFIEYLVAAHKIRLAQQILTHKPEQPLPEIIHQQLLTLLSEYMLTGGMPEIIATWCDNRNITKIQALQRDIIEAYRQDFDKYANKYQLKYVEFIFNQVPNLISQQFKYTQLQSPYQKRELAPALELLTKANIIHKVYNSAAIGVPLGAGVDLDKFKLIFVDIALCQTILGLNLKEWIMEPLNMFANKGSFCEAFIGQELLAYAAHDIKTDLYYWHREARGSMAEIDYVIAKQEQIIPIEVKSGKGSTLKSLQYFLNIRSNAPYGVRFSTLQYSNYANIYSYPLYAVAALFSEDELLKDFCSS